MTDPMPVDENDAILRCFRHAAAVIERKARISPRARRAADLRAAAKFAVNR